MMYLHEALREPDRKQFLSAMRKEVKDQMLNGNWEIMKASTALREQQFFPQSGR